MTKSQAIAKATKTAYPRGASVRFGKSGEVVVVLFGKVTAGWAPDANGAYAPMQNLNADLKPLPIMEDDTDDDEAPDGGPDDAALHSYAMGWVGTKV